MRTYLLVTYSVLLSFIARYCVGIVHDFIEHIRFLIVVIINDLTKKFKCNKIILRTISRKYKQSYSTESLSNFYSYFVK